MTDHDATRCTTPASDDRKMPDGTPLAVAVSRLYNASKPLGMGWLQATPGDVDPEVVAKMIVGLRCIDYMAGRIMKVNLDKMVAGTEEYHLYDRENGPGSAIRALEEKDW